MNDTYVEVLVARKKNPLVDVGRILSYVLAFVCFVLAILGSALFFVGAIVFFLLAYLVFPRLDIEYEYLYIDKEISVDKIMSKEKRKNVYTVDLNRMEIMAPVSSHALDSYKARGLKSYDFTSRAEDAKVYSVVYESAQEGCVIVNIEPNAEMLNAIKTVFPRKVSEY